MERARHINTDFSSTFSENIHVVPVDDFLDAFDILLKSTVLSPSYLWAIQQIRLLSTSSQMNFFQFNLFLASVVQNLSWLKKIVIEADDFKHTSLPSKQLILRKNTRI